ncbi:MAG: hypothetical protein RL238_3317 [Actinomycetota bacterium]|jgi:hypothetical protein
MSREGPLTEREADHIVEHVPMKIASQVEWLEHRGFWKAVVPVTGAGVTTSLVMDLTINKQLPGKYTMQLRQRSGVNIRRLDVRGSHSNRPETGNSERWQSRTHKHRYRDMFEDAFAYTPTDIPDTTSSPFHPEPDEHGRVFEAFCGECGIDHAGQWTDPPGEPFDRHPGLAD